MNENLECGHRNDIPHVLATMLSTVLRNLTELPPDLRSAIADEFSETATMLFAKAGIPNPVVDGAALFNEVRNERLNELLPKVGELLREAVIQAEVDGLRKTIANV